MIFFHSTSTIVANPGPGYLQLTMGEEPTVLAFETGNELGGFQMNASPPPVEWTKAIADYLKLLAPNTLVISGSYGVREVELGISSVDI